MRKVLDASAFINGYIPVDRENYTVPEVSEEIKDFKSRMVLERALAEKKLVFLEPADECMRLMETVIKRSGDVLRLSETDKKVIGLALTLKKSGAVVVVTDDYTMQNTLKTLGIPFRSIMTAGIQDTCIWRKVCRGCKKIYPDDYKFQECEICGSEIIRKRYKSSENH